MNQLAEYFGYKYFHREGHKSIRNYYLISFDLWAYEKYNVVDDDGVEYTYVDNHTR